MIIESAHAVLRDQTRHDHDTVDAAFAGFDLAWRPAYTAFLRAHARVLPELERRLAPALLIADWVGRTAALERDLRLLGETTQPPNAFDLPDGLGARWGALYVIEGSRLGGSMLARAVGAELPAAYLRSTHAPGKWRSFLTQMDAALGKPRDLDEAIRSAKAVFVAYRHAAEQERNFA